MQAAGPDNPKRSSYRLDGAYIVTGGGNGIGLAAALACASRGGEIAVLDIDKSAADTAAREALEAGAPASIALRCDVRSEESVANAIGMAAERLGPICGLVTSAGIARGVLAHELALDTWNAVIETNLTGTFLASKHVLMQMLEHDRGGSIVCISSPWGAVSAPGGVAAYSASKGGVSALVRSLALDYAPHSIRVNAVLPGATETSLMWADVPEDKIPALRERICKQLVVGRLAEPAEIACGITWLLSDEASYVTGTQLVIDGGLLARASIES